MSLINNGFKIEVFLILILMSLSVGLHASSHQHPEIISYNSSERINSQTESFLDLTNNQQFGNSQLTSIKSISRSDSNIILNRNSNHIIHSNALSGKLQFNPLYSYKDLLEINAVLYPILVDSGIGSLNRNLIQPNILNLNISDTIYSNSLSSLLDTGLIGNEIIQIQIGELVFDFNQEDFAYANLVIEFDNFNLIIIYKNTQSYIDFGFVTNSSDSIKVLNPLSDLLLIDIFQLTQLHNISYPNSIVALNWNVYSDKIYDFSVNFSKFSIVSNFNPSIKINNQPVDLTTDPIFLLLPNLEYSLSVINDIDFLSIEYSVFYNDSKQLENEIYYDNDLFLNSTLRFDEFYVGSFVELFLPPKLEVRFVDSIYSDLEFYDNKINFTLTAFDSLFLKAKLTFESEFEYTSNLAQQGNMFTISHFTKSPLEGRLISLKGETTQFSHVNEYFETYIPNEWGKGEILILLWFSDGSYYEFFENLKSHPSKLISSTNYSISIAERTTFKIIIQNITSQTNFEATTIYSYFNEQLRSHDVNLGLTLNPGEFEIGNHILLINATYPGLVPVVFELYLHVEPFDLRVNYEVIRNNIDNITFIFEVPDVTKWSVESYLTIQGVGFNDTFEFWKENFEITVQNENWLNSTLAFNVQIILGNNIANHTFDIIVPPYLESRFLRNTQNQRTNDNAVNILTNIVIASLTSSLGIISYKLIKSNYGTERISF